MFKKNNLLAIRGALGAFSDHTGTILLSSYPLTHICVHVNKGSNLIRTFYVKIQNMKTKNQFFMGSLRQTQRFQILRAVTPHQRADKC